MRIQGNKGTQTTNQGLPCWLWYIVMTVCTKLFQNFKHDTLAYTHQDYTVIHYEMLLDNSNIQNWFHWKLFLYAEQFLLIFKDSFQNPRNHQLPTLFSCAASIISCRLHDSLSCSIAKWPTMTNWITHNLQCDPSALYLTHDHNGSNSMCILSETLSLFLR